MLKQEEENMINLETLTNNWYTIKELSKLFKTEASLANRASQYHALRDIGHGELWNSGRHNHIWIQDLLNCVSGGVLTIGGQGKKEPDLYGTVNNEKVRIEVKGFVVENEIRVSASKFFANNGGMTQLEKCKTNKEKNELILSHYSDDYYLLTKTNGDAMKNTKSIYDINVYLIKTTDMVPQLKDGKKVPFSILDLSEAK